MDQNSHYSQPYSTSGHTQPNRHYGFGLLSMSDARQGQNDEPQGVLELVETATVLEEVVR